MSEGQIYKAMPKIAAACGAVAKDRINQQQGWKFRGIDDVLNAVHGPMSEHGVFLTTELLDIQQQEQQTTQGKTVTHTMVRVKTSLWASDGSFVACVTPGEAMDSGDKSASKAMSVALRTALIQTFTLPTCEDDPDEHVHEVVARRPAPAKPATPATAKPAEHPAPSSDAVEKAASDLVRDILACRTVEALNACQARIAKAAAVCTAAQMERIHAAVAASNGMIATAPKPPTIASVEGAYEAASTDAELDAADKAAAKLTLTAEHKARLDERRKQAVANVEAGKM